MHLSLSKKGGIRALLDGTIVLKQKKTLRVRKGSGLQIGQGQPESKRASMDAGSIMGPGCTRAGVYCKTHCRYSSQCAGDCESRSPHLNRFLRLGGG